MSKYGMLLKAIADEKRLRLISLLLREKGEFYVCEIADALRNLNTMFPSILKNLKWQILLRKEG